MYATRGFAVVLICLQLSCRPEKRIDYLGQTPPGKSAVLFAKDIITTDAIEHSAPVFSPDGMQVLWTVMELPSYKTYLLEMEFENGRWTSPRRPAFSHAATSDAFPSWSPDGTTLYFSSSRPVQGDTVAPTGNRIWQVEKKDGVWEAPRLVSQNVLPDGAYANSISEQGTLYFTHGPFRSPDWNILSSRLENGHYTTPKPVDINTTYYEDGPYVSPDESFIIFESNRPGGLGGIDLYISFRREDRWTEPVNMGPVINSASTERFARLSPDGRFLFFGSDRRRVNDASNLDIYWIDATIIEDIKNLK